MGDPRGCPGRNRSHGDPRGCPDATDPRSSHPTGSSGFPSARDVSPCSCAGSGWASAVEQRRPACARSLAARLAHSALRAWGDMDKVDCNVIRSLGHLLAFCTLPALPNQDPCAVDAAASSGNTPSREVDAGGFFRQPACRGCDWAGSIRQRTIPGCGWACFIEQPNILWSTRSCFIRQRAS
eukprot:jgi/Botrbrau1/8695/Bobra.0311s0010.1